MKRSSAIKAGLALVALALGGYFAWRFLAAAGEPKNFQYFYDLSEARLYKAPMGTIPPHAGVGGASDDGVEAVVLLCPTDPVHVKDKIAYLETYTDEQKAARQREAETGEQIPGLTREWIAENTLLRRPDDADWTKSSSPEGAAIRTQGIRQKCPVCGQWLKVHRPK